MRLIESVHGQSEAINNLQYADVNNLVSTLLKWPCQQYWFMLEHTELHTCVRVCSHVHIDHTCAHYSCNHFLLWRCNVMLPEILARLKHKSFRKIQDMYFFYCQNHMKRLKQLIDLFCRVVENSVSHT